MAYNKLTLQEELLVTGSIIHRFDIHESILIVVKKLSHTVICRMCVNSTDNSTMI